MAPRFLLSGDTTRNSIRDSIFLGDDGIIGCDQRFYNNVDQS